MNLRRLLALSLCVSIAHAAPIPESAPGLAALTNTEGSTAPSDLAVPSTFSRGIADFNGADSNLELALRVFPISGGGYWLVGRHAGDTSILPGFPVLAIAKYLPDGTLDSTYGTNGRQRFDTPMSYIADVARGPGDAMYALGAYTQAGFADTDYGVYCVDAEGDPCAGFGVDGFTSVPLDFGDTAARHDDSPVRIIYAYGSLYLAGSTDTGSGADANYAIAIAKISAATGDVDAGFGNAAGHPGVFRYNFDFLVNGFDNLGDIVAYSPTPFAVRLVVVGTTQRSQLAGEDTDGFVGAIDGITGQTDSLFDASGFVEVPIDIGTDHKDRLDRVIRRANGSFLVAGSARDASASPAQYQLVLGAYLADGSYDPAFGTNGIYQSLVMSGTNRPYGLAERVQNRDIVVGINILDDLFGDSHPLQGIVQLDSFGHVQHALAVMDFEGTPKSSSGTDLVIDNNIVATAGYRSWSSATKDWDMTIVRYIATDSIFADRFGGPFSD